MTLVNVLTRPQGSIASLRIRDNASYGLRFSRLACRATSSYNDKDNDSQGELLRLIPLTAGAIGISTVLVNRLASGIEPALLASSSQSRADVLAILLSSVLCLTGLQWLSLKPKPPVSVELDGDWIEYYAQDRFPSDAIKDLKSAWAAIQSATRADSLVLFKDNKCIMHVGYARPNLAPSLSLPGPICRESQRKGSANYLANLALFPGRAEFYEYLPRRTQSVIIQPCGEMGVMVVGSGTQRAFTILDQAWMSAWNQKLEVALND